MVHIESEDDMRAKPNAHLPSPPCFDGVYLAERLGKGPRLGDNRVVFHIWTEKWMPRYTCLLVKMQESQADDLQACCEGDKL